MSKESTNGRARLMPFYLLKRGDWFRARKQRVNRAKCIRINDVKWAGRVTHNAVVITGKHAGTVVGFADDQEVELLPR